MLTDLRFAPHCPWHPGQGISLCFPAGLGSSVHLLFLSGLRGYGRPGADQTENLPVSGGPPSSWPSQDWRCFTALPIQCFVGEEPWRLWGGREGRKRSMPAVLCCTCPCATFNSAHRLNSQCCARWLFSVPQSGPAHARLRAFALAVPSALTVPPAGISRCPSLPFSALTRKEVFSGQPA